MKFRNHFVSLLLVLICNTNIAQKSNDFFLDIFREHCVDFRNGSLPDFNGEKWGFKNKKDSLVIGYQYDSILYAGVGLSIAIKGETASIITESLKVVKITDLKNVNYSLYDGLLIHSSSDEYYAYKNGVVVTSTEPIEKFNRPSKAKMIRIWNVDTTMVKRVKHLRRKRSNDFIFEYKGGEVDSILDVYNFELYESRYLNYWFKGESVTHLLDLKTLKTFKTSEGSGIVGLTSFNGEVFIAIKSYTSETKKHEIKFLNDKFEVIHVISDTKGVSLNLINGYVYLKKNYKPYSILTMSNFSVIENEPLNIKVHDNAIIECLTTDSIIKFYGDNGSMLFETKDEVSWIETFSYQNSNFLYITVNGENILISPRGQVLHKSKNSMDLRNIPEIVLDFRSAPKTCLYNAKKDELIMLEGKNVLNIGSSKFALQNDNGKWQIINQKGKADSKVLYDNVKLYKIKGTDNASITKLVAGKDIIYQTASSQELNIDKDVTFKQSKFVYRNQAAEEPNIELLINSMYIIEGDKIIGFVDENYNVSLWLKEVSFALTNQYGKYNFVIDENGNYNYIRYLQKK